MKVETPTREFVFNGKSLPDPNPSMSVEQVRECQPKAAKNGAFATVHGINETDASSVPSLGPGQLLTTRFLESLKQSLRTEPRSVLLPANVLAYTSDLLIWWTGPRLHPMYFSEGAEDRAAVHGKACPHPSLIWKVRRGRLSLRALGSNVRPSPETELMVAPYWNTEARTGSGNLSKKHPAILIEPLPVSFRRLRPAKPY
jgi:PRTRC genetic system protein B